MARTVLVFGASGTIGQGVIKVSLEKGKNYVYARWGSSVPQQATRKTVKPSYLCPSDIRAVGVFRSQESADKTRARLGNPPQDNFISVVGTTGRSTYVCFSRDNIAMNFQTLKRMLLNSRSKWWTRQRR